MRLFGRALVWRDSQQVAQAVGFGDGTHFGRRQFTVVNADLVNQPSKRCAVGAASDAERLRRLGRGGEQVVRDLHVRSFAVDVELEALGLRGAVIGRENVRPLAERDFNLRDDVQRFVRPAVDEMGRQLASHQQQVVAAERRRVIHARENGRRLFVRHVDPRAERKLVRPVEVREIARFDVGVPVELECSVQLARRPFGLADDLTFARRIALFAEFAPGRLIQRPVEQWNRSGSTRRGGFAQLRFPLGHRLDRAGDALFERVVE